MPSTPNKLLVSVLALVLVFLPLGNVSAAGGACEGPGGAMSEMDHAQHLDASQTVKSDMGDSEGSGGCQCCADHECSVCACGTAVALTAHLYAQPERMHGVLIAVSGDRECNDRQAPPFKPPRV